MNEFLVDLDYTATRQRTTISYLTSTVEHLKRTTKDNSNLESRINILESLTADNISQAPPDIVDTNSAKLHTISSIYSSNHDTCTSTRTNKRRK